MSHHVLIDLSDLIILLLDAQRHLIREDKKGAERLIASASLLLRDLNKSG